MDARNLSFLVPVMEAVRPAEQRPSFDWFAAKVATSGGNQHRQILPEFVVRGARLLVHEFTRSIQGSGTTSVRACAVSPAP